MQRLHRFRAADYLLAAAILAMVAVGGYVSLTAFVPVEADSEPILEITSAAQAKEELAEFVIGDHNLDSALVANLLPLAPVEQAYVFSDGVLTFVEYTAAHQRMNACILDAGVHVPLRIDSLGRYHSSLDFGKDVDGQLIRTVMSRCQAKFTSTIDMAWAAVMSPFDAAFLDFVASELQDCRAAAGIVIESDDRSDAAIAEFVEASAPCIEKIQRDLDYRGLIPLIPQP